MRKNSNSWLVVLLFAVIIFVFAINFGPWVGQLGGNSPYAAEVNGVAITFPEFQMAYSQQIRMIQTEQADFNPEGPVQEMLKKTVMDRLVAKSLLAQLAQKQDFSISDRELAAYIKTNIFGADKGLDRKTYQQAIYSSYHMSESQFESQLRKDLLAEQMGNLVEGVAAEADRAQFFEEYVAYLKKGASIQTNI
ncbi:MAG: SurA N-terminal domain-containing protein [Myxococcota bacterium]